MKINLFLVRLLSVATVLLVASCGGGSGGSSSGGGSGGAGDPGGNTEYQVSANFIKGPVTGGSCELFRVNSSGSQGSSLGSADNSIDGLVEFPSPISYTGTVLIECSGGTYVDESSGDTLNAPNIRAVANLDSDNSFVVSPLTEMAVQLAEADGNLGMALTSYNSEIADLFGIEGDITEVLPAIALEEVQEVGESGQYLLALTLVSQMHADSESTLTTLITDLASDLMDKSLGTASANSFSTSLDNLGLEDSESQAIVSLLQSLETALTDYIEKDAPADVTAPSGYTISNLTNPVNLANQSEVRFTVNGAEVGANYQYQIYSSADGGVPFLEGSGMVSTSFFEITDLDLSQAGDGVIELRFSLVDESQNRGQILTAAANKSSGAVDNVTISGRVTFDRVGRNSNSGALDYSDISAEPARGVTVEAVNSSGTELATTVTDSNGEYSLNVTEHTYVRIRVRAEMNRNDDVSWYVSVEDNTNNDALYVLQGELFSSGGQNSVRDLHAGSGWTGSAYTNTRSAAPFAILDTVHKVLDKFVEVDPYVFFPSLKIFWSRNNNSASGNINQGDIGTSYYSGGSIYLLGDEDGDTDEYDEHIIAHEWGHYFEDRLSRSDSIGGSHSLGDKLDMRVAFGEGWGNAISAIALDDPVYTDSSTNTSGQLTGFTFDIEENNHPTQGWYSEASTHSILYDIYDDQNDDADTLSLGLSPIYDVFVEQGYVNTDYLTSIFVFLDKLREFTPLSAAAGIDALAMEQDINGTGHDGSGETNNGGIPETVPLYKTVSVGGSVELCSTDEAGVAKDNFNSLGARDFAYLELASTETLEINITRVSGNFSRDPDMTIWKRGLIVDQSLSEAVDQEIWNGQLNSGNYVLEVYDYKITENDASGNQTACFEVTVSTD